jgi:hypothetical protein
MYPESSDEEETTSRGKRAASPPPDLPKKKPSEIHLCCVDGWLIVLFRNCEEEEEK